MQHPAREPSCGVTCSAVTPVLGTGGACKGSGVPGQGRKSPLHGAASEQPGRGEALSQRHVQEPSCPPRPAVLTPEILNPSWVGLGGSQQRVHPGPQLDGPRRPPGPLLSTPPQSRSGSNDPPCSCPTTSQPVPVRPSLSSALASPVPALSSPGSCPKPHSRVPVPSPQLGHPLPGQGCGALASLSALPTTWRVFLKAERAGQSCAYLKRRSQAQGHSTPSSSTCGQQRAGTASVARSAHAAPRHAAPLQPRERGGWNPQRWDRSILRARLPQDPSERGKVTRSSHRLLPSPQQRPPSLHPEPSCHTSPSAPHGQTRLLPRGEPRGLRPSPRQARSSCASPPPPGLVKALLSLSPLGSVGSLCASAPRLVPGRSPGAGAGCSRNAGSAEGQFPLFSVGERWQGQGPRSPPPEDPTAGAPG